MADSYTEVTRTSGCQNFMNSIAGVFIGIIVFILSFPVLVWNQGRPNPGEISEQYSKHIAGPSEGADGDFVSSTGPLTVEGTIGDDYLTPGAYITLQRKVEMYAWEEKSESETKNKVGGGTETTTRYTYHKTWTSSPSSSSTFKEPSGHHNPEKAIDDRSVAASEAKVGDFRVTPGEISLPGGSKVPLSPDNVILPTTDGATGTTVTTPDGTTITTGGGPRMRLEGEYLYLGQGSLTQPEIGDLRISYTALSPVASATVFGRKEGDRIAAYQHEGKTKIHRVFLKDRAGAIEQMKTEHKMVGYAIGFAGFFMMWIGMTMIFGPIQAVANVIPFIGQMTGKLIGCVTFPIALVLTLVAVMVGKLLGSPIAMLVFGIIVAGAIGLVVAKKLKGQQQPLG